MTANSKTTIEIDLPPDRVFSLVVKALEKIGAKVWHKETSRIEGRKLSSFKSFGEDIVVTVEQITEKRSRLLVKSKSLVPTTLFDWGANNDNVKKIIQEILAGAEQERAAVADISSTPTRKCPKCGRALQNDIEFCPYDGTALGLLCSQCGQVNALEFSYCAKCGSKL